MRSQTGGYGATRPMVYDSICEVLGRAPSKAWFNKWMKVQYENKVFRMIKSRPIDRKRITIHDTNTIKGWFNDLENYINLHGFQRCDIYNFDEVGFRVGMAPGQDIVVTYDLLEVYLLIFILL